MLDENRIKLHIDSVGFKEKPKNSDVMGAIKSRLQNNAKPDSATIREIAKRIGAGHSI